MRQSLTICGHARPTTELERAFTLLNESKVPSLQLYVHSIRFELQTIWQHFRKRQLLVFIQLFFFSYLCMRSTWFDCFMQLEVVWNAETYDRKKILLCYNIFK